MCDESKSVYFLGGLVALVNRATDVWDKLSVDNVSDFESEVAVLRDFVDQISRDMP